MIGQLLRGKLEEELRVNGILERFTFFQSFCDLPVDNNHLMIKSRVQSSKYPCHKISLFSIARL